MASIGTLYTIPAQTKGRRIRAAAAIAGLTVELPASYTHYEDNKKPEFTAKFPHGKIPALETKEGFHLFESVAIGNYIASRAPNSTLLGSSPEERALVDQWVQFADNEIDNYIGLVYQLCNGILTPYAKPLHTAFVDRINRGLTTLEKHLASRTFVVGERISLADINVASVSQRAVSVILDAPARAKYPSIIRHLETIVNHPKIKDILGPITYAEKPIAFVPPAKEKKEKAPKPAATAPKAEKKAEKKPKKEEEDEEEDDLIPKEEPKGKNPLDLLPKSTFNLEDWKRAYSNKETRGAGGSIEWFYQNFDKDGFSNWRVDFKYNEELTQTFMSSNQIGGYFNRLEASRKYLFGSVGVLGTTNNSVISGVLIARGQDIKPVVDVAPDWESYSYTKLDLENPADKEFFEAALAWDLELEGKKWVDGKNFK